MPFDINHREQKSVRTETNMPRFNPNITAVTHPFLLLLKVLGNQPPSKQINGDNMPFSLNHKEQKSVQTEINKATFNPNITALTH